MLPFNAKVRVQRRANGYALIEQGGYVFEGHLAPLEFKAPDWVATAERFVGTPYVWGGNTHAGLDCSGLLQVALAGVGHRGPARRRHAGGALSEDCTCSPCQRGDIVFWNGHVGIMLDADRMIHANAFHMQVEIEPLLQAVERITPVAGAVTSIKRL